MFDHFTFAASGRPISSTSSAEHADSLSIPTIPPHHLPSPLPSPHVLNSSLPSSTSSSASPNPLSAEKFEEQQNQSPLAQLASQMSEQTIKVEPTDLYDYDHGLASPALSNEHENNEYDVFPTVDSDMDNEASGNNPLTLIALSRPKFRSTRVWSAGSGMGASDFRARRWKRQVGSRILCERGLEKVVEELEENTRTAESTAQQTQPSSVSLPPNIIPQTQAAPTTQTQPPTPLDEGFFEAEVDDPNADADAEALRLFQLQRPAGIRKWRGRGDGVRCGGLSRYHYRDGDGDGATENGGKGVDGESSKMVLSVPRMRRKIGRRKRSREGERREGPNTPM